MIQTGFHVPRPTQVVTPNITRYPYGTVTLYGRCFHSVLVPVMFFMATPTTPTGP